MTEEGSSAVESSGEANGAGWTNEYVREGFDVDGAESRVHPLGMDRRIRLARAEYAVASGFLGDSRALYPGIRWLGELLGREAAAEQLIAETEYVINRADDVERGGPGTRLWWLGIAYLVVGLTGALAVGIALAAGLIVGVPRLLSVTVGIGGGGARLWTAFGLVLVGSLGLGWLILRVARTTG